MLGLFSVEILWTSTSPPSLFEHAMLLILRRGTQILSEPSDPHGSHTVNVDSETTKSIDSAYICVRICASLSVSVSYSLLLVSLLFLAEEDVPDQLIFLCIKMIRTNHKKRFSNSLIFLLYLPYSPHFVTLKSQLTLPSFVLLNFQWLTFKFLSLPSFSRGIHSNFPLKFKGNGEETLQAYK